MNNHTGSALNWLCSSGIRNGRENVGLFEESGEA